MSHIVRLNAAAKRGIDQVGGKAATLGELAVRHNVPDGFVIVTDAFVEHFQSHGLDLGDSSTGDPGTIPNSETLARLRALPLDTDLAREVQQAFSELPSVDGTISNVRRAQLRRWRRRQRQ